MNRFLLPGCGACGRKIAGIALGCERCGIDLHSGCYLALVATEDERQRLMATEQDTVILCRGCRS